MQTNSNKKKLQELQIKEKTNSLMKKSYSKPIQTIKMLSDLINYSKVKQILNSTDSL